MDTTIHEGQLIGLAGLAAVTRDADKFLVGALPAIAALAECDSLLVLRRDAGELRRVHGLGTALDISELVLDPTAATGRLLGVPIPLPWHEAGVQRVSAQLLPGHSGFLVLAWLETATPVTPSLEIALSMLDTALGRIEAEHDLADLAARVDNAQILANMGDYDWHIPTDTNTWSDQLFRIYGHEPRSFNPSYERFISLLHPEDQERITGLHQHAYSTGEPYKMIERIVRPDGEVRYLSSNGEVLMDETGTPERMRGTCIDITERVLAEEQRELSTARFRGLVESAPDALLVLDEEGRVLEANPRAHELLGGDPTGHQIDEMLPVEALRGGQGIGCDRLDTGSVLLDVTTAEVAPVGAQSLIALFLRDANVRLAGEALAARVGEEHLRRRQALEINDNVVQGLVSAMYALETGKTDATASFLERTLDAARGIMDELLEPLDGSELLPGDLTRQRPASLARVDAAVDPDGVATGSSDSNGNGNGPGPYRGNVLVVDDAEDLRMLLRMRIERSEILHVVGEAPDGRSGVEAASRLQPHLVLLDLAMPEMDGLEALPLIRAAVPGVKVVVLSGFKGAGMAKQALEAGADHYVEKGGSLSALLEMLESMAVSA